MSKKVEISYFLSQVSCGFPSPADDYLEKKLSLDEHLIRRPTSTFFVKAQGESMMPVIRSGDLLVIDRAQTVKNGDIILAIVDGEFTVKRFLRSGGSIHLLPENHKYPPIEIKEEDRFELWGVVMHIIHSPLGQNL